MLGDRMRRSSKQHYTTAAGEAADFDEIVREEESRKIDRRHARCTRM
jgi:hypothetical protein